MAAKMLGSKIRVFGLLMAATLFIISGCAPEYVRDYNNISVERFDSKPLTLTDMEHVVRLAAFQEGWQKANVVEPGHILATKEDEDGSRSASVDVIYTATQFSIHYKDTRGFHYDGANHKIDHHYLSMVDDLRGRILDAVQEITPGS